jgi:hypothetical protein
MDFKLSKLKSSKTSEKMVSVPKSLLVELMHLTYKAECTAVWDARNNEYIKLNDIPEDISDRISTYIQLAK